MQDRQMQDMKLVRCVICDDHEALRLGLSRTLDAAEDLEVVGQTDDGAAAIELIACRRPDVAIVDLHMPGRDGIEIATAVAEAGDGTAVLLYTGDIDPDGVRAAFAAGAAGYVLKSGPVQDIPRAVRAVARGQLYVDPTLAGALLDRQDAAKRSLLTRRESEVLQLLADGLSTQIVAETLFLAPATVRSYIENAMQKLDTSSRTAAVARAMRGGLIK